MKNRKTLIFSILIAALFTLTVFLPFAWQLVEMNHLNNEINRYTKEIEYLKGSNDLLKEENRDMQDIIWNINNNNMKETVK